MTYDSRLIQETLARAQKALHEGDLSRANRLLQRLHAAGHGDAASHQMLAIIATDLGLFDHARRHMDEARRRAPGADGRPRTLVIRAWGAGFWADVLHTIHGLALAEATGRTPIVHWGRECRYRRAGIEEAWRLYFEPVSALSLADVERDGLSIFPPKWTRANLREIRVNKDEGEWSQLSGLYLVNRPEDVAVLDFFTELDDLAPWFAPGHPLADADPEPELGRLYRRHLRLVPGLGNELERLEATLIRRRPTIAMHFRTQGLPKVTEAADRKGLGPEPFVEAINRYLASHPEAGIYLTTDFAPAVLYLRAIYGDRVACREVTRIERIEDQSLEIHQQHDGVVLGREVVLDTFLAARCDAFIGDGASGVSHAVTRLKDWPEDAVTLLRPGQTALAGQIRRHGDPSPWWNPPE
jgi:protein O-GlcNAc transferase